MKLLVCVKQVLESESGVRINDSGKWIERSGSARFEMNPFDACAVEEALLIKEKFPDSKVHAITVGPDPARDTLSRALGMGADEAIHIVDNTTGYRPPVVTASWIAAYAGDKNYDLILTGIMSADEMNAQTGPVIAQRLCLPCCTATLREEIWPNEKKVSVEREIEGGARDMFDISLPCVLTLQTGINCPRYPSLSKVLRARKKEIDVIQSSSFEKIEPVVTLETLQIPQKKRKGILLTGTLENKVDQLIDLLGKKALL
ncbi:MAG: electron transfer flavoprotein subunit beta/FixA family protein [Proteobacteria bacterium]|nr:electron transfer flavoprotein subunit beta/FixA family protein [Pseudomonadota bacterium]MBU1582977.1 electron transfer flavoprotein subunit beta/FixA family protein [Pseudomonadota bacterium]MBU2452514.1 electron transfer flavoprotein subunit beta/FixA family protein [Pseudomonadota bacterium]MBU2631770.1 electron transfer flavoprotein subunit beta/FixA family protein [Pseudomonadota bacterium]